MTLQSATATSTHNKRLFERWFCSFGAIISTPSKGTLSCSVGNFCIGGMYLCFNNPPDDSNLPLNALLNPFDLVDIHCRLPSPVSKTVVFKGKIVRLEENSAGVAFVNPDLSNLQLLQELAKSVENKLPEADSRDTEHSISDALKTRLITGCDRIFKEDAFSFVNQFLEEALDNLVNASKTQSTIDQQNAFFQGFATLEKSKIGLSKQFRQFVVDRLNAYTPEQCLLANNSSNEREETKITLTLMDDNVFEDWLADTVAVAKIESLYRQPLIDLEKRLSVVWGKPVSRENNPYGPYVVSHFFLESIKRLGMAYEVNKVCYKIFDNILLLKIGHIYEEQNKFLIANDILPVIHYEFTVHDKKEKRASFSTDDQDQIQPVDNLQHSSIQPPILDNPINFDTQQPVNGQNTPPKTQQPGANRVAQSQPQSSNAANDQAYASQTTAAGNQRVGEIQNLYQIVGKLRDLQQELKQKLHARSDAPQAPSTNLDSAQPTPQPEPQGEDTPQPMVYQAKEIQDAITNIQQSFDNTPAPAGKKLDLRSRIEAILHKDKGGSEQRVIGVRETQIMDVADNIFHSLLADKQVANRIRKWIKQLEAPVLKIALADDSLFLDRSHLVRQVINKITQLELFAEEGDSDQQQTIQGAIKWIVDLINNEFDGSTKVFSRAVKQLDILTNIQSLKYKKNVESVISQSKRDESKLACLPVPENIIEDTHDTIDKNRWALAIKKIKRLKEDAWLVFDINTDKPHRVRLAWIASHINKLVFVNVAGKKDRIVDTQELTHLIYTGDVVILDNADEPAMDRAQHTMLQDLHSKLIRQSSHDQLTGLINRREFEKELGKTLARAKCEESRHTLCFIDIDQFQIINNTCSYEAGDALLVEVSKMLSAQFGNNGILARIGSDEFGMLLSDCSIEDALDISEQQIEAIRDYRFDWDEKPHSIAISIGVVPITNLNENASALMQAADSSCNLAKEMGGNRIQLYHSGHTRLSQRNKIMEWKTNIDEALESESFTLRCQKILPIQADGDLKDHYEILLMVKKSNDEQFSIQEFIEAAEMYNRIPDIDRWVIKHTLNWMADNQDTVENIDVFSINLSGKSLEDETLIEFISEQLRISGVATHKVCFEITETAGILNLSDAAEFIEKVKETGCRFSLDDFGSGMSSYAYLKNLPVDYLKIDGAFIKDVTSNSNDYAVVKSICEIGHFMGKKIVAECVENDETLQLMKELSVDFAQGYGIEKPINLSDLF